MKNHRSTMRVRQNVFVGCRAILAAVFGLAAAAEPVKNVAADGKAPARELLGLPLVFFENFEAENADRWEQSDPQAWKLIQQNGNRVYNQFQQSHVQNPVRSPFNRALVKDLVVGDFVL